MRRHRQLLAVMKAEQGPQAYSRAKRKIRRARKKKKQI